MLTYQKSWLKFGVGFLACIAVRLLPFRPPNIEPILAAQMPFSRAYGALAGFGFAFFNIIFFDAITQKIGPWTLLVALAYGSLGLAAPFFFRRRRGTAWDYAVFAFFGTLFFDAVTGLSFGPLFFGQSFMEAVAGQIPFTAMHLLGNVSFSVALGPALYRYLIKNEKTEIDFYEKKAYTS